MNQFLKYYGEHGISPVSQDISDLEAHIVRRKRLYRLLGIDYRLFRGANILEVGAGSGYNTLVFLLLGARVDIVEPNPTGRDEMIELFRRYNIDSKQYKIYPCVIEEFSKEESYDFVIAEGFLPTLDNREMQSSVVSAILANVKEGGIIVTTSMCEFSYFYEDLRRLLGYILIGSCDSYESKVSILSRAYKSHLENLKFATRPIQDWVKDAILNPTLDSSFLDLCECVKLFGKEPNIEVIATSPNLITNLGWYKDAQYSYKKEIINGFASKRHLLISTEFNDSVRLPENNIILLNDLREFRGLIKELKKSEFNKEYYKKSINILKRIIGNNRDLESSFIKIVEEVFCFIESNEIDADKVASMQRFSKAWGRGQQYIAFIREGSNG